jgi:hypothetical protein
VTVALYMNIMTVALYMNIVTVAFVVSTANEVQCPCDNT